MEGQQNEMFIPDPEYLQSLLSMGFTKSQAEEALFCTGNESIEAAISYVFTNLLQEDPNDEMLPTQDVCENTDQDHEEAEKRYKMTFVVNASLKMGIGKVAAQVAHACLGLYRDMKEKCIKEDALNIWDAIGEKKIVLKGNSTSHLQELFEKAEELNVPCYLVHDAGHTQIPAGSVTVLSVFGDEEEVNAVTGSLSLL